MVKKILVPLDGSELAEGVLPYVREIAGRAKAEVLLFSAVAPVATWDAAASTIRWDREEALAQDYVDLKRQDLEKGGLKVTAKVALGDAADAIAMMAAESGADLIALSTHGRSGVTRWLFGSVAAKLVQRCEVPLLVVRPGDKAPRDVAIKQILVPLDGSDLAHSIMPNVEEMARALGASLLLFHAVSPVIGYPGFEAVQPSAVTDVLNDMQEHAKKLLVETAAQLTSRGVQAKVVVTLDMPVDGIVRAGEQTGADMIALATHGRGGLGRAVMGSVADGVVRRASLPCLVIHAREP